MSGADEDIARYTMLREREREREQLLPRNEYKTCARELTEPDTSRLDCGLKETQKT